MKYNNIKDKYLQQLNDLADQIQSYGDNALYKIIPEANNNSRSMTMYYQRLNYEIVFNSYTQENAIKSQNFKDYIYTHNLYGKINLNNDVINTNDQFLKPLNSNHKITLLAPAADAFNDLFDRHKILLDKKGIQIKSKFANIIPQKGYVSPNLQHSEYVNRYFNEFYNFINNNNLNKKILNFKSFIKYFIYYYNENSNKIINKTEFIKTSGCNLLSTGLIVEISQEKYGDDKNSFINYVTDSSFGVFDNLSKQYGFVMDKHSPWRLTFDIAGANAQEYLKKYNVNSLDEYFNKFYYFTEYFNYETLKINLLNLYNFIVNEKRDVRNVDSSFKNGNICISEKITTRQFIKYDDLQNYFSDNDMLKFYFYTKAKENNIISSEVQFEQQYQEALTIKNYNNLIASFDFIENLCRKNKNLGNDKINLTLF